MDLLSYSCNMCGEQHKKYLSSSTNKTTCRKCGNLIELSSQINNLPRHHINLNNRNNKKRSDPFNFDSEDEDNKDNEFNINSNLESDFYDFNRYSSHNDYLPSRDINNYNEDFSELNDNMFADEFDQFYMGNIINNNNQSRPLKLTNTRYNFSNINLNKNSNSSFPRNNQRSLSTHHLNNNNNYFNSINLNNNRPNNNPNNGMFSIQISKLSMK